MVRIGVLSDTHGYWDDRYVKYFSLCDEIWHSGDIGSVEIIDRLQKIKPVRAVYGNIDGPEVRQQCPKHQRFTIEGAPKLFISGHSHILKVMYDNSLGLLHINPGAAGIYGAQRVRTIVCFSIDGTDFKDMEVIEMARQ